MNNEKLPALKGFSGACPVYIGYATLHTLGQVSFVDKYDMDKNQGVQRPLDVKHAKNFSEYIQGNTGVEKPTAPPLIFSLREPVKFENGHLIFPANKKIMARLDCQHRLAFTDQLDVTMPFVIYHGLDIHEEIEIFTTVNDEHKGMTKSLVDHHRFTLAGADAEEQEPHLAIAERLNEDKESPWFGTINTGGVTDGTAGTKRKLTLRTFQQANKDLISGPRCSNAPFEEKYDIVKNYWRAVAETFPDEWGVKSRNHLLMKGVGIAAIADVGRSIIEEAISKDSTSADDMKAVLSKLAGFDWGNKSSPFANFGGRKGATAAAKVLNAVLYSKASVYDLDALIAKVTG